MINEEQELNKMLSQCYDDFVNYEKSKGCEKISQLAYYKIWIAGYGRAQDRANEIFKETKK